MVRLLVLPSFLFLGVTGCDDTPGVPVTVTDSAGVRITLTTDLPVTFAEVYPDPVLTLGGSDASGSTQFFRVQHVHVDQEDRLWVADGQSGELRIFHSDGAHWKTIGGGGEGPGEFRRIRLLGSFGGDSIAVWDDSLARLTVFDAQGELIRTQQFPSGEDPPTRARGVFEDGDLLGQVPRILPAASLRPGDILGDSARLVRVGLRDSTQVSFAGALGPLWLWTGRSQVPIPFTTNAGFEVLGGRLHLVQGPEFRVRVFEGGQVSEIYGVVRSPRAVSTTDREEYRAFVEEYLSGSSRADYLTALDHPRVPGDLPAYSRVLAVPDRRVWARIYSPDVSGPALWDVFRTSGEWLGQVVTPGGFTVMAVTEDRLTGVWRDDLGVEHIMVYRLDEGRGAT
jgi:hypothetical protein